MTFMLPQYDLHVISVIPSCYHHILVIYYNIVTPNIPLYLCHFLQSRIGSQSHLSLLQIGSKFRTLSSG